MLIGYARVSKADGSQTTDLQRDALLAAGFQNDHLDEMQRFRDEGPTYPIYVVPEFAHITLFEHVGEDDETVVDTAPGDLPAGWADRTN